MKYLFISFLLFGFVGFNFGQSTCMVKDSLGAHLLEAFKLQNYTELQKLQPTVSVLKKGFGKELKTLNDNAIQKMISENPKTKADWTKINEEAKKAKINFDELSLKSVAMSNPYGDNHPLAAIELTLLLGEKTYKLAIAVVRDGNCLYFNEFLNSTSIWE
ncbi:MAG: hypothetical protein IPF63_01455 [Bacteroidetes bacterium]|nr:hypothetical protein [Bacteroidota bacterium]